MKGIYGYGIVFLIFLALVVVILVQNLGNSGQVTVLWMKTNFAVLILCVGFFGLLQGICLSLFFKYFFTSIQRSELTKFDLDKPL